ncbi:MAG: hypothetical protein RLZZ445_3038 [Pseudomonadota bacterium]|jgi:cytochrome c5
MRITTNIFMALLLATSVTTVCAATPAEQYEKFCTICHLPGSHGAPKVGDHDAWTQRLRSGLNSIYRNAIEGIPNTTMLAKGGQAGLPDSEFRAIVDFMIAATALPPSVISDARRYDRLGLTDRDFIRRDVSRDGYLSRQEVGTDPVLLKGFSRFDINRDGRLSETEYRNAETALERERIAVNADDASLNTAVGKALAAIKGLKTEDVKIEISAGALVLSGVVAHPGLAIEAHDAVKRVAGLKSIQNRLITGDQMGWD